MFSVVRKGEGLPVNRRKEYSYQNLAYNFLNKKAEIFQVTVEPKPESEPYSLNAHPGQEINYVLSGEIEIHIGGHTTLLRAGDTIYFNSAYPHGMKAVHDEPATFLAIVL
jgi:quercetin dioxygenase-like cupin family protein